MGTSSSKSKNKRDSGSVAPFSGQTPQKKANDDYNRSKSDLPSVISTTNRPKSIPSVVKKEPSATGWSVNADFNFEYTESQSRRDLMASCEDECSEVTDFLFVGAAKVTSSEQILDNSGISRIINLAPSVCPNHFEGNPKYTYLSIDMLDGRLDDISWFICEVIQFIEIGRYTKKNTLIHCEKGISRSCSMAIAYIMWASESTWKSAFEYMKSCRAVCAPNTGFTCNLIEIDDLLHGESRSQPMFFRLASHLSRDPHTPVLKLVRSSESRKIILPRSSFLHSDGVFIIRPAAGEEGKVLYVWKGRHADPACLKIGCILAQQMMGVFCDAEIIELVDDGAEPADFLDHLIMDEDKDCRGRFDFDDLFVSSDNSVSNVQRRRSIGTSAAVRSSFTSHSNPMEMHLEDADEENEADTPEKRLLSGDEQLLQASGGDKIVVAGHVEAGFMPKPEVTAAMGTPRANKKTLVLKHTLSMDRTSDSSIAVERPQIKNLTSTNLTESIEAMNSASGTERVASSQSIPGAEDGAKVKPKLYLSVEENGVKQWQACGVYDDDDLLETSLLFLHCGAGKSHFIWVGREFSVRDGGDESAKEDAEEVRGAEGTSAKGDESINGSSSDQWTQEITSFVMKMSRGDLGDDVKTLTDRALVIRQGNEGDEFWDKFYEGS